MKRIFAMLLALMLTFGLVACSITEPVEETPTTEETVVEEAPVEEVTEPEVDLYGIEFVDFVLGETYDGEPCIYAIIDWTNMTDGNAAFYLTYSTNAFQNGIGLDTPFLVMDEYEQAFENRAVEIRPGSTVQIALPFALRDNTTTIEFEITKLISFTDEIIAFAAYDFIPAEAPTEEITEPTVEESTLDPVESAISANFTNYQLAIYNKNGAYCVDILTCDQSNSDMSPEEKSELVKTAAWEIYRSINVDHVIVNLYGEIDGQTVVIASTDVTA